MSADATSRLRNDPEVREWLQEARQQGFTDAMRATSKTREEGRDYARNMERYLWAAVMSNGGRLNVTRIALEAYDSGAIVTCKASDPLRDVEVLLAERRA